MRGFANREEAGRALADALDGYDLDDPLILAVPRGGVTVAAEVARRLGGELDLVMARKLGAPGNPELAMGAVAADGLPLYDSQMVARLGVTQDRLDREVQEQAAEVRRREQAYRGDREAADVAGRTVVVVDDGVATGATLRAALGYVRRRAPARLICAVPVGPPQTLRALGELADEVVCPIQPASFMAVGEWYRDFHQVSDAEVVALLEAG